MISLSISVPSASASAMLPRASLHDNQSGKSYTVDSTNNFVPIFSHSTANPYHRDLGSAKSQQR